MLNEIVSPDDRPVDGGTARDHKLALIERMADDLAHDIRNPLHSMVINLEVLRRRISTLEHGQDEELLRYAGILASELERVNRRVDLVLAIARPEARASGMASLDEIFAELDEVVALARERRDLGVEIEVPTRIGLRLIPRSSGKRLVLSLLLKTLDSLPRGATASVRASELPEGVEIHFQGSTTGPSEQLPDEDDDLLRFAAECAAEIGGLLETRTAVSGPLVPDGPGSVHYILRLPIDPARPRVRRNNE